MPTFILPPLKEPDHSMKEEVPPAQGISAWERRISVPVDKAIMDAARVNDKAEIVLRGTIREMRSSSDENNDSQSAITIEITEVSCYTDDEERFREDVRRGYGSAK